MKVQIVPWSQLTLSSIVVDMEMIDSCPDVFFPNGTCKENFELIPLVLCDGVVILIL